MDQRASRIHLYFHDPNDPNIALVEHNERVEVTRLTPALMEEMEISDDNHAQMQSNIGPHAYRRATTEWMLRCDIDELIHIPGDRKLADLLAQINPKEVDSIRIEMAEVLQSGRTGSAMRFRTEIPESELEAVYGDVGPLLAKRLGLIGHAGARRSREQASRTRCCRFMQYVTLTPRKGRASLWQRCWLRSGSCISIARRCRIGWALCIIGWSLAASTRN